MGRGVVERNPKKRVLDAEQERAAIPPLCDFIDHYLDLMNERELVEFLGRFYGNEAVEEEIAAMEVGDKVYKEYVPHLRRGPRPQNGHDTGLKVKGE